MLVNCPHCNISFDAPEKKAVDPNSECDFCEKPAEYEGWYSGEVKGLMALKNVCSYHLRYLTGGVQIGGGPTPRALDFCPACDGSGYVRVSPTMLATCKTCNGTGKSQ